MDVDCAARVLTVKGGGRRGGDPDLKYGEAALRVIMGNVGELGSEKLEHEVVLALEIDLGERDQCGKERCSLGGGRDGYTRASPFPEVGLARGLLPFKDYRPQSLPVIKGSPQAGTVQH